MLTKLGKTFTARSNEFRYNEIVRRAILDSEADRKDGLTTAPTKKLERLIAKAQKAGAPEYSIDILREELQRRLRDGTAFKRCYAR